MSLLLNKRYLEIITVFDMFSLQYASTVDDSLEVDFFGHWDPERLGEGIANSFWYNLVIHWVVYSGYAAEITY
ncbi:hypothetical protein Tco_0603003 [Tanacetum coccineum]